MDKKELKMILDEGEGYKVEFKENVSNLEKALVSFANSSGGRIFLGVSDNSEIRGIKPTNELKSRIQDMANKCRPKIKISFVSFNNILIIQVREGEDKPYECSSGFFKRIGSVSQKMMRDEIINFIKSEGKVKFDELIQTKFIYPKDFDKYKLLKFLELAGLSKSLKVERILLNLAVCEKQEGKLCFNNAGILFFAKEPQKFVPWSVFTVALFKDMGGADVIDRKEITGGLFEIVEKVMDFIKLYSKVAYKFTGKPQREEIYEYPFEAIREAVINSVMHKDYFEHGHNNILKFFPDRVHIENIWIKPRNFVLGKTVFRRNHLTADLFSRIDFGEKLGSGMQRMKDICKAENAPYPKVEYTDTHFYILFRPSREYLKMAEMKAKRIDLSMLNDRQQKALDYINKRGRITNKEYVKLNKISRETAKRDLSDLLEKRFLKLMGKGRSVFYVIGP